MTLVVYQTADFCTHGMRANISLTLVVCFLFFGKLTRFLLVVMMMNLGVLKLSIVEQSALKKLPVEPSTRLKSFN